MDHEVRISKLEATVETLKADIDRLYHAVEQLRQHTDQGFAELRASMEANTRWQQRLVLANTGMMAGMFAMIAGMFAKVLGLY